MNANTNTHVDDSLRSVARQRLEERELAAIREEEAAEKARQEAAAVEAERVAKVNACIVANDDRWRPLLDERIRVAELFAIRIKEAYDAYTACNRLSREIATCCGNYKTWLSMLSEPRQASRAYPQMVACDPMGAALKSLERHAGVEPFFEFRNEFGRRWY